jgi:putative hemolysin
MSDLLTFSAAKGDAAAAVPGESIATSRYEVRFAKSPEDLDRLLRLRYEVFNLELHEGLDGAHASGRDEDEFDRRFHHLMILERSTGAVVGTYRMQTGEMAAAGGFYSAGLFDVAALPEPILRSAVEVGRACIAKPHRNGRVLHLLWRGLAAYLTRNRKTRLFGCCSLTSQVKALGAALHAHLEGKGAVHPTLRVMPRAEHACGGTLPSPLTPHPWSLTAPPRIPALFQAYLTLGAKALGPPAIDREFKTIDWLVLLDVLELDQLTFRTFFR